MSMKLNYAKWEQSYAVINCFAKFYRMMYNYKKIIKLKLYL